LNKHEKFTARTSFEKLRYETRRHFLKQCTTGLGMMAMGSFLQSCGGTPQNTVASAANPLAPKMPHFAGKAKSVIYLHGRCAFAARII
jgi:hypothetical protein